MLLKIFIYSVYILDVANQFAAAVLKPLPSIRQHLAYQAPEKLEREENQHNVVQNSILIKKMFQDDKSIR